jgi:hypothetical protein
MSQILSKRASPRSACGERLLMKWIGRHSFNALFTTIVYRHIGNESQSYVRSAQQVDISSRTILMTTVDEKRFGGRSMLIDNHKLTKYVLSDLGKPSKPVINVKPFWSRKRIPLQARMELQTTSGCSWMAKSFGISSAVLPTPVSRAICTCSYTAIK